MNAESSGSAIIKRADLFMTDTFLRYREVAKRSGLTRIERRSITAANTIPPRVYATVIVTPGDCAPGDCDPNCDPPPRPERTLAPAQKKRRQGGKKRDLKWTFCDVELPGREDHW